MAININGTFYFLVLVILAIAFWYLFTHYLSSVNRMGRRGDPDEHHKLLLNIIIHGNISLPFVRFILK